MEQQVLFKRCRNPEHNKVLPADKFFKDKGTHDGLMARCKECTKKRKFIDRHSKEGVIKNMYDNQVRVSIHRGQNPPSYTKKELIVWVMAQPIFHILYNAWVKSNYNKWLIPSCDRINNDISYTFNNLQVVSWRENFDNGVRDMKAGLITHGNNPQKETVKLTKNNRLVYEYPSVSQAARDNGVWVGAISCCCRGITKEVNGYIYMFKSDYNG